MNIYCAPHDEQPNCFQVNRLTVIADIQSEKRISKLEALHMLVDSNINNPITLKNCDYWIEYE